MKINIFLIMMSFLSSANAICHLSDSINFISSGIGIICSDNPNEINDQLSCLNKGLQDLKRKDKLVINHLGMRAEGGQYICITVGLRP